MTNSKWVILDVLWDAVLSHLYPCSIGSEWHCTFPESQSHHIISYDQQFVSDIAHLVTFSLITSFPMIHREWVTLHICEGSLITSFLWPTGSEWLHTYFDLHSQHTAIHECLISHYFLLIHIRKWACCHIFSTSSFYIIIIIDCKISFQLTHSHLMWLFISLKLLSLISRWVVLLHEVFSIS